MKFSQRIGRTPLTKELQLESIDEELKNGLWNIYDIFILSRISTEHSYQWRKKPSTLFSNSLWHQYFKKPIDRIPSNFFRVKSEIRHYFFNCNWYQVYDLIESTINIIEDRCFEMKPEDLFKNFNHILE